MRTGKREKQEKPVADRRIAAARRNPYRFLSLKFFVLSFLISLILLSLLGLPLLLVNGEDAPSTSSSSSYTPDWNDRLNLLTAIRDENDLYSHFVLIGLRPYDDQLAVAMLPPQLQLVSGDKQNSIAGFCNYGGVSLCAKALEQSYGLRVDRTALLRAEDLKKLVNALGGVSMNLTKPYIYEDASKGVLLNLSAGFRQLDGVSFVRLLCLPTAEQPGEQLLLSGQLIAALINQKLQPRAEDGSDSFAQVVEYLTTDLSYSDYINRADALDEIASKAPSAELLGLAGTFSYGNMRFVFSSDAEDRLQEVFG